MNKLRNTLKAPSIIHTSSKRRQERKHVCSRRKMGFLGSQTCFPSWCLGIFALNVLLTLTSLQGSEGKWINPVTDVCWECLFPITLSGVNITPGQSDLTTYHTLACTCPGLPPKVGIPLTFWQPTRLVDVTRHAYKLMGLGGISIGQESVKNRGSIGSSADGSRQHSFYHVHWYTFPILALFDLFPGFSCLEQGDLDIQYITELDPLWGDDTLSFILNPEAALYSNPAAHLACVADCVASSTGKPIDKLFWCAGCEGSLYPFTGTVAHHVGGVQASALLVHRFIAKMHRTGLQSGFDEAEFCTAKPMPLIKKSLYKTQMTYPTAQTSGACHPLGQSDTLWGSGKNYPFGGEDFVYLIWVKQQCCLDAVKPSIGLGTP